MVLEKVLVITYYWPPSGGAGVQRTLKFVKYFLNFGLLPVVLTVDPSKASYPVVDESLLSDVPKGVKVITTNSFEPLNILSSIAGKKNVPYGGFANANKESLTQKALRWIRGNFFIPDARVGWVSYAVNAAKKIIKEEGITCVYISSPPHSSQLIGLELRKSLPHLCWIADLRDPWTDIYYYKDLLHTPLAAHKDAQFERNVLEQANIILVVSDAIKRSFLLKSDSISEQKIHVIPNGYDEDDFKEKNVSVPGQFVITYVGTMADIYKPEVFFNVLSTIIRQFANSTIKFRFVGNAPVSIRKMAMDAGVEAHCEWIGHVSHAAAVRYMQEANMLLLVIPDSEGAKGILTGKLFEYLGARNPILGIGPADGDAAAILNECAAGVMLERSEQQKMLDFLSDHINTWKSGGNIYSGNEKILDYRRSALARQVAHLLGAEIL
jgi:glycosyltransferase involved in cell wall biosynthesis